MPYLMLAMELLMGFFLLAAFHLYHISTRMDSRYLHYVDLYTLYHGVAQSPPRRDLRSIPRSS
jgi:hypothetical protein